EVLDAAGVESAHAHGLGEVSVAHAAQAARECEHAAHCRVPAATGVRPASGPPPWGVLPLDVRIRGLTTAAPGSEHEQNDDQQKADGKPDERRVGDSRPDALSEIGAGHSVESADDHGEERHDRQPDDRNDHVSDDAFVTMDGCWGLLCHSLKDTGRRWPYPYCLGPRAVQATERNVPCPPARSNFTTTRRASASSVQMTARRSSCT